MNMEQYLTTFSPYPNFYSSLKQQAGQLLDCLFSCSTSLEVQPDGTHLPQFVVVKRGEVEQTLSRFRQDQLGTPQMHACFVLGAKVAKSATIFPFLKGMRVLLQGKKDRNIPYSYVVYYAPPQHCISFCQALAHPDLAFIFNIRCGGVSGVALVDTGATHTFVRRSFVNTLGLRPVNTPVSVQLADGQTMTSAGTVSLRLHLSRTYVEQRKFIVCDRLLDGIDVILGNDFLKDRGAFIDYAQNALHLKPAHFPHYITLRNNAIVPETSPINHTKIISAISANRALRKGAQMFWGVVREETKEGTMGNGRDQSWEEIVLGKVASATMKEEPPPWDTDEATDLNLNSRDAIGSMTGKPKELRELLLQFLDVFPDKLPELPPDRGVAHTIPMEPGHVPPCRPTYRLAEPEVKECRRHVEELLTQGFIRPSSSPYGSPILFVRKKDGSFRMVIDYRAVNNLTRKDKYPLPRIDDLLDKLQGSQYFSSFDLLSGYHQVRLHEADVPKTAFRTPFGSYEFLVMPFGLTNAPSTFQRLMNSIFHDFIREGFVVIYLDDLLIHSQSLEDHYQHLARVLERLREQKLYAKLSKCDFLTSELCYLGHVVGRDGLKVDPAKVKAIKDWPTPTTATHVRQFLGLANYFRKFVKNYSTIAAPLTHLTGKTPWIWGNTEQHSFDSLKNALVNAPTLVLPNPQKPYRVVTDASDIGVGAVLLQDQKPVAYFSKKFNSAETRYSTTEKELLGVLYALKEWRCYVLGTSFVVVTDHKANSFLQTQSLLSPRRARWAEYLQQFDIKWEWSPGVGNPADPLSRCPNLAVANVSGEHLGEHSLLVEADMMGAGEAADSHSLPSQLEGMEAWVRVLKDAYLVDGWLSRKQNRRKLAHRNGFWYKNSRLYVPSHYVSVDGAERNLRREILENLHGPPIVGHQGRDRTIELVARSWWWPGVNADVTDYVAHCDSCQRVKPFSGLPVGLLHPLEIPSRKWESMSMDLITGLPKTKSGYNAIWVGVDRLSKFAHFAPTSQEADAADIAQLLRTRVFTLHGFPREIVSDRDPRWVGKFCQELFRLTGCRSALSTAFHPQSDGQTERINRILEDYLRHYVGGRQTDWDKHLCEAEFAYNNTYNQSINTTPFRLTFGQDPVIPFQEIYDAPVLGRGIEQEYVPAAAEFVRRMRWDLERARTCLKAAQERQKAYADKRRRDLPGFEVGQQVLLSSKNIKFKHSRTKKLLPRYIGPFPVTRVISPVAYKLLLPTHMRMHDVFHVSLLKPYKTDGSVQPPPPPEIIDGELEYEVEAVLAHRERKLRGKKVVREYLIKWSGYESIHNTWEPEENLVHSREAVQQYWSLTTGRGSEAKRTGTEATSQRKRARRA